MASSPIRPKGSGQGFSANVPPVSFRVSTLQRKKLMLEAIARRTTLAALARKLCLQSIECPLCQKKKDEAA